MTEQRRTEAELRSYADVVAHDLSEPIAAIEVLVRLLARRAEEPPSADVLRQLRASTERSRDLIDGVLVYARAGELSIERVALGRLAAEVAEDLGPSLAAAAATLEIGELPAVDGDPRQLRRVLQNLVGNALKFRGEAPPRVELSARRDRHEWVVTVRDADASRRGPRSQGGSQWNRRSDRRSVSRRRVELEPAADRCHAVEQAAEPGAR